MIFFLVFFINLLVGSCSRLNWLPVGFWLHVKHLHSHSCIHDMTFLSFYVVNTCQERLDLSTASSPHDTFILRCHCIAVNDSVFRNYAYNRPTLINRLPEIRWQFTSNYVSKLPKIILLLFAVAYAWYFKPYQRRWLKPWHLSVSHYALQ